MTQIGQIIADFVCSILQADNTQIYIVFVILYPQQFLKFIKLKAYKVKNECNRVIRNLKFGIDFLQSCKDGIIIGN